jgi:hypothetical protein
MNRTTHSIAGACLAALALNISPAAAQRTEARSPGAVTKRVSLKVDAADLRQALKLLFNSVGVSYTLDPAVQGQVTASLTDVPFRTALESLLRSTSSLTKLTYRVEDNVYYVVPKVEGGTVDGPGPQEPDKPAAPRRKFARIQLNYANPVEVALALGGGAFQSRTGQSFGVLGAGEGGTSNRGSGWGLGQGLGSTFGGFETGSGSGFLGNFNTGYVGGRGSSGGQTGGGSAPGGR